MDYFDKEMLDADPGVMIRIAVPSVVVAMLLVLLVLPADDAKASADRGLRQCKLCRKVGRACR